jgi:hypothetical protein
LQIYRGGRDWSVNGPTGAEDAIGPNALVFSAPVFEPSVPVRSSFARQRNIEIVGIGRIRAKRSTLPHLDGVEIRDNTSSKQ